MSVVWTDTVKDIAGTKMHVSRAGSGPTILFHPTHPLHFTEQIEEHQNRQEGRFGGEEFVQAEVVGRQIVFQFGNAILPRRALVVVAPEFFGRLTAVGDKQPKGIAGYVD